MFLEDGSSVDIVGKTALNEFLGTSPSVIEISKRTDVEPAEHACFLAKQTLKGMCSKFDTDDVEVYLTGKSNFRVERATILPYKGNRDPFDKPVLLSDVRSYLVNKWNANIVEGMEADDAMGLSATDSTLDGIPIVCSNDKDMKMIPGLHYDWTKDSLVEVSELEGWRSFYKQMLIGDRTDNIPGLEGVGEKTAAKLLEGYTKPETMWCGVFQAYFNRYGPRYSKELHLKEALQEIGDLLWIKRTGMERWLVPE